MSPFRAIAIMASVAAVWALKPFVTVRFGSLFVSRLGHLTGNTECYLCEKDLGLQPKRTFDIWCPQGEPANSQIFKMYRRVMNISRFAAEVNEVGKRFPWWSPHTFNDSQWGRDIHNLMEKTPPHLSFTRSEERRAQKELRRMGIPEGGKWICLINRDPMYLRATQPAMDYSYHSFRDSDIQNYREAVVHLMQRGYFVIRMGRFVDAPMKLSAPGFIDYAVSGRQSDFMDVYLGAKCEFCISNGTGFDGIPMVFRRPICFVNEAPFEYLSSWMVNSLAIWKHHIKDGKRMSMSDIVKSGAGKFSRTEQFDAAGIKLQENTPEEIRDAAIEMLDWHEGKLIGNAPQSWFWDHFPRSVSPHNGVPLHGEVRLRIGTKFLSQYEN